MVSCLYKCDLDALDSFRYDWFSRGHEPRRPPEGLMGGPFQIISGAVGPEGVLGDPFGRPNVKFKGATGPFWILRLQVVPGGVGSKTKT